MAVQSLHAEGVLEGPRHSQATAAATTKANARGVRAASSSRCLSSAAAARIRCDDVNDFIYNFIIISRSAQKAVKTVLDERSQYSNLLLLPSNAIEYAETASEKSCALKNGRS